jgi:hypothetical protein
VHRENPFLRDGGDGVLPSDFTAWRFGVTYTVRPELLLPLISGREYRITVAVRRRTGSYGDLYWRAAAIAGARLALLNRTDLHTWIVSHGWRSIDIGLSNLLIAFLTIGLVCPNQGHAKHEGERPPTAQELLLPGGATLEVLQRAALAPMVNIWLPARGLILSRSYCGRKVSQSFTLQAHSRSSGGSGIASPTPTSL